MEIKLPNRTQGEYKEGYQWQEEVFFHHCDVSMNVRMSTLIGHLASVGGQHYRSFGRDYKYMLENDTAFALIRATFTIHKMPECFSFLNINTWLDGTKGTSYQRIVQWENQQSEVLVSCRSEWVLISASNRTLLKPDQTDTLAHRKCPIELPYNKRIRLPKEIELEKRGEHKVMWSEIDGNGHMYSGHYGDIVWDFLPEHLRVLQPSTFSIELQKECCLDDVIVVSGVEVTPNEYIMVGECEQNSSFKARVVFGLSE